MNAFYEAFATGFTAVKRVVFRRSTRKYLRINAP
jgi:hypothetical protein